MAVQKVLLLGCFVFVVSVVNATSKDEIQRSSLYRLAEDHIGKTTNRPSASLPTKSAATKTLSTSATSLNPVYVPPSSTLKQTTKHVSEKVVEKTKTSTESGQPVVPREKRPVVHDTKTNTDPPKRRTDVHSKSKGNPKHEEISHTTIQTAQQREDNQNAIAEEKTGILGSGVVPFLASIGTALAFGGLAYYAYPVPEISARSYELNPGSFDNGVKIVHPSDLTPQEVRRLMSAGAYHVNARSKSDDRKPHPYVDLARRVYDFVRTPLLGGNSEEEQTGNNYDIGSLDTNKLIQPYNLGQQNIGQAIVGQHNIGQPIVRQQNIGPSIVRQQNIGQPIVGQHILGQPDIGHHINGQPVVGQHVFGQQNIGHPHIGQPMFGQQIGGQPILGQQVGGQPILGQQLIGQPNFG